MSRPKSQGINRQSLPEIAVTLPPVHPCRSDAPGTATVNKADEA